MNFPLMAVDGIKGMMAGSATSWVRTTLSSFGSSSDLVESSVSSKIILPVGVDDRGSTILTLDKSKWG